MSASIGADFTATLFLTCPLFSSDVCGFFRLDGGTKQSLPASVYGLREDILDIKLPLEFWFQGPGFLERVDGEDFVEQSKFFKVL